MPAYPRPLAVGLMQLPATATQRDRSQMRIAVAVKAADEGYALLEAYETGGYGIRDELSVASLRQLAERFPAQAVVHVGAVDLEPVRITLKFRPIHYLAAYLPS